jgi:hypothetical protein
MSDNKKQDSDKELKRLLDAHVLVAKNKLGRTPNLEDLQKMLEDSNGGEDKGGPTPIAHEKPAAGEPKQEVKSPEGTGSQPEMKLEKDEDPAIMSMKVYYGTGGDGEEKKPDPNKVLFYETKDGRSYDVENQNWLDKRPGFLDHLPCRPLNYDERDIVAAIAHGVMGDEDYMALDKAGMLDHFETPKRLWDLTKKLKSQLTDLEKSEALVKADDDLSYDDVDDSSGIADGEPGALSGDLVELVRRMSMGSGSVEGGEVGENVLQQIMQAAMAAASSGLEDQIRAIVHEELQAILSEEEPDMAEPESEYEDIGTTADIPPMIGE